MNINKVVTFVLILNKEDLILKGVVKDKAERKRMIEQTAVDLEISDVLKSLPSEISGGQAQRVSMARAFLYPSDVMLLDEPFKALDTALKTRLIKQFAALQEKKNKTVVFVTHAIDACLLLADDYFVFDDAPVKIVLQGKINSKKSERKLTDKALEETRNLLLQAIV